MRNSRDLRSASDTLPCFHCCHRYALQALKKGVRAALENIEKELETSSKNGGSSTSEGHVDTESGSAPQKLKDLLQGMQRGVHLLSNVGTDLRRSFRLFKALRQLQKELAADSKGDPFVTSKHFRKPANWNEDRGSSPATVEAAMDCVKSLIR